MFSRRLFFFFLKKSVRPLRGPEFIPSFPHFTFVFILRWSLPSLIVLFHPANKWILIVNSFKKSNLSKAAFTKANTIPWMTLNNILAAKLLFLSVEMGDQERKHQYLSPYKNADKALLLRIKSAQSQNTHIS